MKGSTICVLSQVVVVFHFCPVTSSLMDVIKFISRVFFFDIDDSDIFLPRSNDGKYVNQPVLARSVLFSHTINALRSSALMSHDTFTPTDQFLLITANSHWRHMTRRRDELFACNAHQAPFSVAFGNAKHCLA